MADIVAEAQPIRSVPRARQERSPPPQRHAFRYTSGGGNAVMLHMALVFLVIGLIAALLGFTSIAGASIAIAKFLAGLFLVLFLVFLIIGLMATRKIVG